MRPIRWLHISDFHLRESEVWSQDAILAAMLDDISRRVSAGIVFDFVLATGDLAYSGQEPEYSLVEMFMDDLASTIGITRTEIFCIPGNHDVDRNRQTTCFLGARLTLQSESDIYSLLSSEEERETLLMRLQEFRAFHERCFPDQHTNRTDDGLGYVSTVDIDDITIAIVGLNSAWFAQGGRSDHGHLLLGECQVTNAIEIAKHASPHIVIGMAHHPFSLLNEFDRPPTQRRIEDACHFFHCGHLHVPDASNVATQSGNCLTLAAGALFESRDSHNSYTMVSFDPLHAETDVTFVRYDPVDGAFSLESNRTYSHEIKASAGCGIGELSSALGAYCPVVENFSYYLAALLVEALADVPIVTDQGIAFGTVALLRQQDDKKLKDFTLDFLTVSNAVKLLFGDKSLEEILAVNGVSVERYGNALLALADADPDFCAQLAERNDTARNFAAADGIRPFSHTLALLEDLRIAEEWDTLRDQAERYIGVEDPAVSAYSKRMLALCLGFSSDRGDRERAVDLYRELSGSPELEAADLASLATLLRDDGNNEQAATTVLRGIKAFPEKTEGFVEIGMGIVEATGDRTLRQRLLAHRAERSVG